MMGKYDTPLVLDGSMKFSLPGRLYVVANMAEIDRLRASPLVSSFEAANFVPLAADVELPPEVAKAANVIVLEVDPSSGESLRRIAKLRAERGDLPIIAAIGKADVSLVRTLIRQGIADVADLPFAPEELASQILDATTTMAESSLSVAQAPMTVLARSAGGCGATTVITHLAAALAKIDTSGKGVCVIDLDLQSGDVASYVGKEPTVTLSALLDAHDRLDGDMVRSAITDTGYGFSVIAAPDAITPLDTVDVDQLLQLLSLARRQFGHVLVDLPADWTNWALSTVVASTNVLMVTDLSISSLRQAKRRIDLLRSVGVPGEHISVVANRMEHRLFKTIGTGEVAEALHCKVAAALSTEGPSMRSAQDQGVLITDIVSKSRFAKEIRELAALIGEAGN